MRFNRITLVLVIAFCLSSCKNEDENLIPNQITQIEQFLNSNELEYEVINGVYRMRFGEEEGGGEAIRNGSTVEFMFEMYPANYSKLPNSILPDPSTAIFSNIESVQTAVRTKGTNTEFWPTVAYRAKVGSKNLIEGINRGLPGCKNGETVWLFMTSDLALGDAQLGPVKINTPVLYIIDIENVTQ